MRLRCSSGRRRSADGLARPQQSRSEHLMQTENDRKVPRTLIKHAIDACATSAPNQPRQCFELCARSHSRTFPASNTNARSSNYDSPNLLLSSAKRSELKTSDGDRLVMTRRKARSRTSCVRRSRHTSLNSCRFSRVKTRQSTGHDGR